MDLRINQKEAAAQIGIDEMTIANWLKYRAQPAVRLLPKVLEFLGYDPRVTPIGLRQRIRHWRETRGWSRARMAAHSTHRDQSVHAIVTTGTTAS